MIAFIPTAKPTGRCFGSRSKRNLVICILNWVFCSGYDVVLTGDREGLLPIHSDLLVCLVLVWKPESINHLIFAYEVDPLDPEGEFLGRMPDDPNDSVVFCINPHFSFKQVFVRPFWRRASENATIWPNLLLAKKFQRVILGMIAMS